MISLSGRGKLVALAAFAATSCSLWSEDNDPVVARSTVAGGAGGADTFSGGTGGVTGGGTGGGIGVRPNPPAFRFPAPEGPVPLELWAQKSAEAVCAYLSVRIPALLSWGNYANSEEPCVDYFEGRFRDQLDLEGLVAAGELAYDPKSFGDCLLEYASTSDSQWEPVQCIRKLGTLAAGSSCMVDLQCRPDMRCKASENCGIGTCVLALAAGDTCISESEPACGVGLACIDGTCQKPSIRGSCRLTYFGSAPLCATGLACWNDKFGEDYDTEYGQCRQSETIDCSDGSIGNANLTPYGDVYGYRCELGPLLGQRCLRDDECTYDNFCESGICYPRHALGESCTRRDPVHSCELGARCDLNSFTCVEAKLARLGELCVDNADCYSASCVEGACVRPPLCRANLQR